MTTTAHRTPDLTKRPFNLAVDRFMSISPRTLYLAWTKQFDAWFADPGSVLMQGEVNTPFFFETVHKFEDSEVADRHPHYGRFLRLEPDKHIELTWVTGERGTKGAETIVTVELIAQPTGTLLKLEHAGFPDAESRDQHAAAWPYVLELLEQKYIDRQANKIKA